MRVLRPVVQPVVLAMLDGDAEVLVRRRVAIELAGGQHARRATSSTAVLIDPAPSQCFLTTTSSRCHLSPDAIALDRMRRAMPSPSFTAYRGPLKSNVGRHQERGA